MDAGEHNVMPMNKGSLSVLFIDDHQYLFTTRHHRRLYRKKDIDKLERIQRRATKMISELRDLIYESRLLQCSLTTRETRRLRGDQIEVFKIVNGYEDVDRNMFFKLKEGSRTRGHKAALVKEQ